VTGFRSGTFALMFVVAPLAAHAKTVCTVVADAADGKVLLQEGDCRTRVTPASTFKIPLAVMGFDAGFLTDAQSPSIPFRKGYPDWGGAAWTQPTDPTRWMKYSVVWYSQQIAEALGVERLKSYATAFDYGNADFTGDPGKNNALERAWISSSLKISPLEQTAFLTKFINRTLPVKQQVFNEVNRIVELTSIDSGWMVHGKTGTAFPRKADGSFDRDRAWGWFVGWAEKGNRTLVFARLAQDEKKVAGSGGARARDAILTELPALLERTVGPSAGDRKAQSWPEEKCNRYRSAWSQLVTRRGTQGLGPEFVSSHEAFLASGCSTRPDVCPRSPAELDVANKMALAALNAGIGGTFLPFACRNP
jgi:beta-lactamase class D